MDNAYQDLLTFVRESCPYYTDLYSDVPETARLDDLPMVDHATYWEASSRNRRHVMTAMQTDGVIMKTGGTTSKPKTTAYSQIDLQRTAGLLAKGLQAGGVRCGDRIANMFYAGDLYGSFLLHVLSVMALPFPAVHVPIGGLTAIPTAAQLIEQCDVNVLLSTSTFLVKIATHLQSASPKPQPNRRVRCVLFGGEPLFPEQEATLRGAFPNACVRSCIYGTMDAGVLAAPSSLPDHDPSVHQVLEGAAIIEIVREDNSIIDADEEPGMLVATNLHRTLCPAIRYPTGDRAAWVNHCAGTFRLLGRAGLAVRVGPVSIDVTDLRRVAAAAMAQVNTTFNGLQAVLHRSDKGLDQLELLVDASPADVQIAANAIDLALSLERPMFKQHVDRMLVAPLVVRFVRCIDFHLAPGSQKMLTVVDQRF